MLIDHFFDRDQDGADGFEEGYFALRREGRVDLPIRVWFGVPHDPETGEPMDRSPRWQVEINGEIFGDPDHLIVVDGRVVETLEGIWPECKKHRIDDYRFRADRAAFARSYDALDPFADAGRIDPMTAPLPGA